jgi:hypothetical protein
MIAGACAQRDARRDRHCTLDRRGGSYEADSFTPRDVQYDVDLAVLLLNGDVGQLCPKV